MLPSSSAKCLISGLVVICLSASEATISRGVLQSVLSQTNELETPDDSMATYGVERVAPSIAKSMLLNRIQPSKRDSTIRAGSCSTICNFCRDVVSRRVAALCLGECEWDGDAFKVCLTVWSITQTSGRLDYR
ncbi:hypothetical protein CAPTEDRAFT_186022 [Capitella teleta]|uniref:Uncharacterized protein n=1 Tax=Capitella teleta TaxID=283909 RepID=R7V3C6_CAPTE|nr:hypothetical protein CAPTEDRAFT_186022 [Capitella teleta]|eukprot:ELU13348.1 hypothetical protein CAPTEDRAFT_186022 [Capitella teleta]